MGETNPGDNDLDDDDSNSGEQNPEEGGNSEDESDKNSSDENQDENTDSAEEPAEEVEDPEEEVPPAEEETPADTSAEEPGEIQVDGAELNADEEETIYTVKIENYRDALENGVTIDDIVYGNTSVKADLESDGTVEVQAAKTTQKLTLSLTEGAYVFVDSVTIDSEEKKTAPYEADLAADMSITINMSKAYKRTVSAGETGVKLYTYGEDDKGEATKTELTTEEKTKKPDEDLVFAPDFTDTASTLTVSYMADGEEVELEPVEGDDPTDKEGKKKLDFYTIKKSVIDDLNELEIVVAKNDAQTVIFTPGDNVALKIWNDKLETPAYEDFKADSTYTAIKGKTIKFEAKGKEPYAITKVKKGEGKENEIALTTDGRYEVTITEDTTISFETAFDAQQCKTLTFALTDKSEANSAAMELTSLTEAGDGKSPLTGATAIKGVLDAGEQELTAGTTGVKIEAGKTYLIPKTVAKITLVVKAGDGYDLVKVGTTEAGEDTAKKVSITLEDIAYDKIDKVEAETAIKTLDKATYFKIEKPDETTAKHIKLNISASANGTISEVDATEKPGVYAVKADTEIAEFTIVADEGWKLSEDYITYLEDLGVLAGGKLKVDEGAGKDTTYTVRLLAGKLNSDENGTSATPLTGTEAKQKLAQKLKVFQLHDDEATAANKNKTYSEDFTDGVTSADGYSVEGETYNIANIPYNAKLEGVVKAKSGHRLTSVTYKLGENGTYGAPLDIETDPKGQTSAKVTIDKVTDQVYLKVETQEDYTLTLSGLTAADKITTEIEGGNKIYTVEKNGKYEITVDPAVDIKNLSAEIRDESGSVVGRGRKIAGKTNLQIWMNKAWQGQELDVVVMKDGQQIGKTILLQVKKGRTSIVVNEGAAISGNVANDKTIPISTDGEDLNYSTADITVTGVAADDADFATYLESALSFEDGNLVYTGSAQKFATVMKSYTEKETGEDGKEQTVTKYKNAQAKIVVTDKDDPTVKSRAVTMTLNPVMDTQKAPILTLRDHSDVAIDVNLSIDGLNMPSYGNGSLYYIITAVGDPDTQKDESKGIEESKIPEGLERNPAPVVVPWESASQHESIRVAKDGYNLGSIGTGWNYTVTVKAVYSLNDAEPDATVADGPNFDVSIATSEEDGGAQTADTSFASKLNLKKDAKHTPKAVSTVYTGQWSSEGLYVATLDWKDKFTPYKIAEAEVKDLTDEGGIVAKVNANDELVISYVDENAKLGKHVLEVTALADQTESNTGSHHMYAARATINVTVVQGIYDLSVTAAQNVVAIPSGKTVVSIKTAVVYNEGKKDMKPKTAKVTYSVEDANGNKPDGVDIDQKGVVKVTSAYKYNTRRPNQNYFDVVVKAADFDGNEYVTTDDTRIYVTNAAVDLSNLVIAKADGNGNVNILARSGEKKAIDVPALDLRGAYIYALKDAATKDTYKVTEWNNLAKENNYAVKYTPEYSSKKVQVATVGGNGYISVGKTGAVTINAAANDGSKSGKSSKNSIKLNVTPTECSSSAALVITYSSADGASKDIAECKKPTAELANKAEIAGSYSVSGVAKLNAQLYVAKTDEKTGAFKSYEPAKGFENYKLTVKGGYNASSGLDGSNVIYTTADKTTLTLSLGKGKDAKKYTYVLTNKAYKASKPKVTVVGSLYTNSEADTQSVNLKVLNGKELFPDKTTVKVEVDRSAKKYDATLENRLVNKVVSVTKDTAELVFNSNYDIPKGSYKMLVTVGKNEGDKFEAVCAPVSVTIKVNKRTAFTFKPATSYTINLGVDGGAILSGKDNTKGNYKVNFAELQNMNDGKGKSNRFTHYFKIHNDLVTGTQTLVLNTDEPDVKALLFKPETDKDGNVKKDADGNVSYTNEYLDDIQLEKAIDKSNLTGYVRYTAEANDKFYEPYKLKDQYAKITVKLVSPMKKDKVSKAVQKYTADAAMIKKEAKSKTQVNVRVNGLYVNVAYAVEDTSAKSNAAELTNIGAANGQITLEAKSALDPTQKKGYTTNVKIVPATNEYAKKVIDSAKDTAAKADAIAKYGVSVKVTVNAVEAKDFVETPKPVNPKPEGSQGGDQPGPGPDEPGTGDEKTAAAAKTLLEGKGAADWTEKALLTKADTLAENSGLADALKTEVETALTNADYTGDYAATVTLGGASEDGDLKIKSGSAADTIEATVTFKVKVGESTEDAVIVTIGTKWNITGVTVTAAGSVTAVTKGTPLQMSATVTGDSGNEVIWSIKEPTSEAGTKITETGELTVDSNESSLSKITVVATSKYDSTQKGELELTVN